MPTPSSNSNSLPPKENALFKRILKCYEQKQYKNGLKFAKQILTNPKYVEHGETLAMKGLTLNCLGRKEEAYEYVKRGLRNDLKSHVCWHVFGLLQRSDKKYDEAIKCYRNALKWDKENIQILRDLSLLQIQMRDLEGYKETRYQLFQLRPTQRATWIGFAMSYHLLNDYDMTLKILEEFRKTQQKSAYDYEHSELLLYQNMVLQESGDQKAALEHLLKYKEQICDKATFLETKGSLLIANEDYPAAVAIFEELISRNPENHSYYKQLVQAEKRETIEDKLELYEKYQQKYPRAQAPKRMPLDIAEGESFRKLVAPYLQKCLRKGVPPLFVDLKPLYKDPSKVKIIEELCTGYMKTLNENGTFEKEAPSSGAREPATALLWLMYYLGQHFDYKGDHQTALQLVDQAMEHTPTLIELFVLKGKIYKHVGDMDEAVKWLDEAQALDTADRYINCKCAKYLLRANRIKEAEQMCSKFTREGVSTLENLNEMQCMWFQTECAKAYQRSGQWGEALKKCIEIDRHFTEIVEDQFDFHTYCLRKMTLRAYMDLLRLEDVVRSQRFFERAAHCAINVYIRLHDKPLEEEDKINELDTENMDPSELKKLRNKQKKAKRKAEMEKQQKQQLQARKELHNKSQKKVNEDGELESLVKDELIPEKLERPERPMGEALKFLQPLQQLLSTQLSTHIQAFEIYLRKQKPLLMLQSLKRAVKVAKEGYQSDPKVHSCVVRFQTFVSRSTSLSSSVKEVIQRETKDIFKGIEANDRNQQFINKHSKSLQHGFVGAKMMVLLDPSQNEKALQLVTNLDSFTSGIDIETCDEVLSGLRLGDFGPSGKDRAEQFQNAAAKRFQMAQSFRKRVEDEDDKEEISEP